MNPVSNFYLQNSVLFKEYVLFFVLFKEYVLVFFVLFKECVLLFFSLSKCTVILALNKPDQLAMVHKRWFLGLLKDVVV